MMLCTDGLSGVLDDSEIKELLSRSDPPGAVTTLVEAAIERGAPDNVTCVVADVAEVPEAPAASRPVVVGAAAEPRTRSQLPGVDFPQDSHLEPMAAVAEPLEPAVLPRRKRRRWPAVLTALVVLSAVVAGAWIWIGSQYYVGSNNGFVTVYNGIPQTLGSIPLSSVVETTAIPTVQLPVYAQELVTSTIAANDRADAYRIVGILDEQAATCRTKPRTEGCPGVASGGAQ
jgi:protein phosphatase